MRDPYDVLGVAKNASAKEIKSAYRKLAKSHHPDQNPDPKSKDRFAAANQAYEILARSSNPFRSTMRTLGMPSASTVASATPLGSFGSLAVASASHSANSRNGSSRVVKSLLVNSVSAIVCIPKMFSWREIADCRAPRKRFRRDFPPVHRREA